jgi:gliding motility-associated-like protein
VCANGNNPTVNTDAGFTTGGIFSATPAGLNINAATGVINTSQSSAGVFTIIYSIPATGCRLAGNSSANFTINPVPLPAIVDFYFNTPVCKNEANPSPVSALGFTTGGTFSSTNGLSINSATGVINLASSATGNYTVTYTIPATGCSPQLTTASAIIINDAPIPPPVANGRNCGPGIINLTASGTTGTVNWYDDASLTNLVHTGLSYGTSLTATKVFYVTESNSSCTSKPTKVTATISTIPEPPLLGNDTSICEGDRIALNAGAYANYTWQDGSGSNPFVVTKPGLYSVQVGNSDGCTNSGSITITQAADCSDIYFPSAFAPDGKNNFFGAISLSGSLTSITRYSLTIYNRYGQIIFSTTHPEVKWDGTFKGKKMGNNSFAWYASYLYRGRLNKKQKGMVTLVR